MSTIITLKNITKRFKDDSRELTVLKDIDLEIKEGEFFVILGPSGSGKSTILRIMSGLEKEFHGHLSLGPGVRKSDFGFMFQQFALLPWMSVYENVELGLLQRKMTNEKRHEKIMTELQKLGLENFASSFPSELSGGMKQRVGIARALVTDPKVIFMDEPFSALDSFTAEELRQEILSIWEKTKITIVMVTHLIPEALELADRIAVLSSRPGTVEEVVKNNLPRPRKKRSADFFAMEDKLLELVKF